MNNPEPQAQQIASRLREQIANGTLGPGALLPSEPELAREYNVSRQTARTALQILEQEGLVTVRPRRGRIVRSRDRLRWHLSEFEHPTRTTTTTSDAWETDIENQGHNPSRQDLDVRTIPHRLTSRRDSTWLPQQIDASFEGGSAISTVNRESSAMTTSTSRSFGAPS